MRPGILMRWIVVPLLVVAPLAAAAGEGDHTAGDARSGSPGAVPGVAARPANEPDGVATATAAHVGDERPAEAEAEEAAHGSRPIADESARSGADPEYVGSRSTSILGGLWYNFSHNLFKPLLLFFYMGFLVPILGIKFEFPHAMYQALTIYLLVAIGWHGGEELSTLDAGALGGAFGFMAVGFLTNLAIGFLAYLALSAMSRMRRIDRATVAGYYGSDSAGTFVTCLGVLASAGIASDAYMPVMLALMEIPGCLVALILVGRLRQRGMDALGNMPGEPGYTAGDAMGDAIATAGDGADGLDGDPNAGFDPEAPEGRGDGARRGGGLLSPQLLHEVLLNPGLYLLFGGIAVGFISGCQGPSVTKADDSLFINLFHGMLCLFLLEMGMTASRKLRDLRTAGVGFVLFGLLAPNLFATIGILVAHGYGLATGTPLALGSYVLFAVLCGASSYIAVPAVQRLAIPEASPTLPLAASLGLTFSYNVTIGIPVYLEIARLVARAMPVG